MCKTQLVPISMSLKEQFFFKSSGFWILEIKNKNKMGYDYGNQLDLKKNSFLGMSQAPCPFCDSSPTSLYCLLISPVQTIIIKEFIWRPILHAHQFEQI